MLSWRSPGDPQGGGAETLTLELLTRAVARGHEITWFGARYPGSPEQETVDGIRYVRQGRQWSVHLRAWRWLRSRQGDFDVVVDQINTLPFLTPLYVPQARRRLLIHQTAREYWWRQTRGLFRLVAPLGYVAEPWYLRTYRSTRVITISESTATEIAALGVPRERITVIPMAITNAAVSELAPKTGPLRVIVIGRLTPAKFVEEAISTFVAVHRRVPGAVLDVVGSGEDEYRARLESIVAEHDLSDAVTFHGRVSEAEKVALLERAHVHVFTSHREGWGLTVTEAAARGTPTVGYDAPGVRDSVRDPRLLATIKDGPPALAMRVVALHEDPALYAELREDAWVYARSLSYEATTDAFLEALR